MNIGAIIIIGLIVLALFGVPIYLSLGISALIAMMMADLPFEILAQKMFAGMNSSSLLAIPFFILAGNIMSRSITGKLIDISNAFIGWIRGSLAVVTVVASALFGAISGSGVATVSAVGGITIPAMKKEKYPEHFAAAIASMASILGPIIPPSITLIVYGSITGESVSKLFLGSVIPGIMLAIVLVGYALFYGRKHDLPSQPRKKPKEIVGTLKSGIWALLMPVIILGGIFGGIFSPTESAAVAVVYALLISFFVYKDMSLKDCGTILIESSISTATILVMVGLSKSSSYVVTVSGLPEMILNTFASITDSPLVILLMINILFLIIGMLMEANAAIVMMTPLLLPLMNAFGIDPIHFGIVMSFNMCIGLITPPVGICMLMGNQIAGSRLSAALKAVAPMLVLSLVILMLITYIPGLTTWLPSFLSE